MTEGGKRLIREARRARQKAWLRNVLTRPQRNYERSLKHDADREMEREWMLACLDYAEGLDTSGARAVADYVASAQRRVAETKANAIRAGDPLNLTGHTPAPRLSKGERKVRAKAERRQQETVVDGDGIFRKVAVKGVSLRGLEAQQQRAAADFHQDWEMALRSLRCRGFEPAVSGGGHGSREHIARVEAQDRLRRLESRLGPRDWTVLVSVVIGGAGPHELTSRGAPQHRVVSAEIKRVLHIVAGFYRPGTRHRDALLDACTSVIEEMQRKVG